MFHVLDCDETSRFYGGTESGALLFYRDLARDGNGDWAAGGQPAQIGVGWGDMRQLICGDGGVLYAIDPGGNLLFFRDLARDGNGAWANGGIAQPIGQGGWDRFTRIFNGGGGIIYAIEPNGDLLFFRDQAQDGTPDWAHGGVGQRIGSGWNGFREVAYGGDGIIYAIDHAGTLFWFRDLARNGTESWANHGAGLPIGTGWQVFSRVLSGQDGVLYGITPGGGLYFYRDEARDGSFRWANSAIGQQIGEGWFISPQRGDVEGYAWPLSAPPGGRIGFFISARGAYTAVFRRLGAGGDPLGQPVGLVFDGAAGEQSTPLDAWQDGCGWDETLAIDIPQDWVSGLYALQCTDVFGIDFHIVFVVNPPSRRANVAVLANTNTWNAYNDWGGRLQIHCPAGRPS